MSGLHLESVAWERAGGLVPAIVQDAGSGAVRMLGWMNREALERTLASGRVTFWSRSRGRLWEKGESSGNALELVSVAADCDGDALLVRARPQGPTCHTGAASCFGDPALGADELGALERVIRGRLESGDPASYTARLGRAGVRRVAQKVGEEGLETALAAAGGEPGELVAEAADLLYHLLVLLAVGGVALDDVRSELARRAAR